MYLINEVVLFKEITAYNGMLFSAFNSICFNLPQLYTSLYCSQLKQLVLASNG